MERFNNFMDVVWTILIVGIMIAVTYFLFTVDFWWGAASASVCFLILVLWWNYGSWHITDDLALPNNEKQKWKFLENIIDIIFFFPFRLLLGLFKFLLSPFF